MSWQDIVKDGETVTVTKAGKTGEGFIVKDPDNGIYFRITGDPTYYSAAGLCNKLTGTKGCSGKDYIRVLKDGVWTTLAKLEKKGVSVKSETRANKIYKLLENGDPVFLSKGSKIGEIVKDGTNILIQTTTGLESIAKFCRAALKKTNGVPCDGYARLYVERGDKRVSLENLLKVNFSPVKTRKQAITVLPIQDPKIDKILHLLKDGTEIFVKDATQPNKYHSGQIFLKSGTHTIIDDTDKEELSLPKFCKKYLMKGVCDKFDKLYIIQNGLKVKLKNLRDAKGKKYFKTYQNKTTRNAKKAVGSPNSNKRSKREKRESFHRRNIQHYEDRGAEREEREVARLYLNLTRHAREGKIKGLDSKPKRIQFIKDTLKAQKNTCYLSDVSGAYCWDVVNPAKYLKLEWAHIMPTCQKKKLGEPEVKENLSLMCSRCNQNLQSGRRLDQLPMEFLTKTRVLFDKLPGYSEEAKGKIEELIQIVPELCQV